MDYKIIQKEAFKVIGKAAKISTHSGQHHHAISKFWEECNSDGTTEKLSSINTDQNMLGVCLEFDADTEYLTYMVAIDAENNSGEQGFEGREIPAATWAVFTAVGPLPHSITNLWSRIFQEWFPETGFRHAAAPDLEVYPPGDTSALGYACEVWVPIALNA